MHVTKHSNQNSPDHADCNDSDKYTVSTAAGHLGYKWIYCCCTSITDVKLSWSNISCEWTSIIKTMATLTLNITFTKMTVTCTQKKLITGNWSKLRHKLEDEHSVQSGTGPW